MVFVALTAVVTYPQVLQLRDGVADIGDPLLNTWALAWVAHQLPYAPAHVFDANIFHPERSTLAYSDTLIAPALIGAPLLWLGAGPIVVYNLLFFAAFVFSGVGVAALVHDLTGRRAAALIAGTVFAFLPFRFDHYSHFQLLQTQWMPMALWFLHRLCAGGSVRSGLGLGLAVGLQALTSMYNTLFLAMFIATVGVVLLWRSGPMAPRLRATAAAAVVASLLMTPVAGAHLNARSVVGERSREEAASNSAVMTDYLAAVGWNRLHGRRSATLGGPERRLFPGTTAMALSAVALWPPISRVRLAYAVALAVAVETSRGFNGYLYPWLYDHVLPFRSLRVPARMGLMAGLALAILAGFGVARLVAQLTRSVRFVVTTALLAGVLADSWVAPMGLTIVSHQVPEVYADLLRHRGQPTDAPFVRRRGAPAPSVLLELPMGREDPTLMYYSTYHWQTLVNGYSGFFSDRWGRANQTLQRFPDSHSLSLLRTLGVAYVTLHEEYLGGNEYRRLIALLDKMAPDFRLVNRRRWKHHEISLYHFMPATARTARLRDATSLTDFSTRH